MATSGHTSVSPMLPNVAHPAGRIPLRYLLVVLFMVCVTWDGQISFLAWCFECPRSPMRCDFPKMWRLSVGWHVICVQSGRSQSVPTLRWHVGWQIYRRVCPFSDVEPTIALPTLQCHTLSSHISPWMLVAFYSVICCNSIWQWYLMYHDTSIYVNVNK